MAAVVAAAVLGAVMVVVVVVAAPSVAQARSGPRTAPLESIFQDDELLLYSPTATVAGRWTRSGLGVDRLRVTVLWGAIAPDPTSPVPPAGFAAGDPAAYPAARLGAV